MTDNLKQRLNYPTLGIHSTDNSFCFGYRKNNNTESDKLFFKEFDNDLCNNLIVEFDKFISKENLKKVKKISVSIGPANFNASRLIVVLARTISQQINCPLDRSDPANARSAWIWRRSGEWQVPLCGAKLAL